MRASMMKRYNNVQLAVAITIHRLVEEQRKADELAENVLDAVFEDIAVHNDNLK